MAGYGVGIKQFLCRWERTPLPFAAAAYVPWLRWKFSLRTLLIAITLAALVLGLIVYETTTSG